MSTPRLPQGRAEPAVIRFVLGGQEHAVPAALAQRTVLEYLREECGLTGRLRRRRLRGVYRAIGRSGREGPARTQGD
jgi:hypothetical protein